MTKQTQPIMKRTTQLWALGDTLGVMTFGGSWKFGTIAAYVETYGGPGYLLMTDDGEKFYGRDESLYVQCSFGGGGDPANQCDEMVPATELYCPTHKATVDEMQQASDRLDVLDQQELRPAADEDLHPKRLDPTMIGQVIQLTIIERHCPDDPLVTTVCTGTLSHYETWTNRNRTIVWFKYRGSAVEAERDEITKYTVKVF